ncbi:MAG TPA: hypothetical protein PLV92_12605, partial [Pirellulaceae bacterium]|nr:hypothetical protein [Pirellulaceae bacterium]
MFRSAFRLVFESLEERQVMSGFAMVETDKLDYPPGATAIVSGVDFDPYEKVTLQVLHISGMNGGEGHEPWIVQADASGAFTTTWYVNPDDSADEAFIMTAIGDMGSFDDWYFTDSVSSVTVTSPTTAAKFTYTSVPQTATISFNYSSSGNGSSYGVATITCGADSYTNNKTMTTGSNLSDSIMVTIPGNAPYGLCDVSVTVTNTSGSGFNSRTGTQTGAIMLDFPVTPSVSAPAGSPQSIPEGTSTAVNLGSFVDPNNGPWTVEVNWGDGSALETFTRTSAGAIGTRNHTYADGPSSYNIAVKVTDSTSPTPLFGTATVPVTVTNVAPTVTRTSATVTVNEGATATNTGGWSDPGVDTVTLTASAGSVTQNSNGTWSWSWNTTDGPDQSQTVTITATDSDGATGVATFGLTVNNVAPAVTRTSATVTVNEGQTATNTGSWSDVAADTVTLTSNVGVVTKHDDGTWSWSLTTTDGPDQTGTVTITATDSDTASSSVTFALTVNNVAPSVSAANASVSGNEGTTINNNGTWSDPGVDVVTLTASIGNVVKNSDGTWSWSFGSTDGPDQTGTVTITAIDSDTASTTTTFALTVNNVPPSVTRNSGTVTVNEGQTANNSGTWNDPGADVVTLTASIGVVTQNSNGTWSWSLGTTDGPDQSGTVTITGVDSDGATGVATFALTVNNVPPSVSVDLPSRSVDQGASTTNSGHWSDPGADIVTLTSSIGAVTRHSDGTWSWSYSATEGLAGNQTVTITATDSDTAATTTTFTLTVNNLPPTVSRNNGTVTVNEGATASNSGTWGDPGGDAVTLTASVGTVTQNTNGT